MFSQSLQPLPPGLDKTRETLHPRPAHNLHRCSPFYVTISGHHGSTASPKLSLPSHRNAFVKNVENIFCVVHEERKRKEEWESFLEVRPIQPYGVNAGEKRLGIPCSESRRESRNRHNSSSQSFGSFCHTLNFPFNCSIIVDQIFG